MRRLRIVVAFVGLVAFACGTSNRSTSQTAKYCDVARRLNQDIKLSATTDFKATFDQVDAFAGQFLAAVPPAIKDDGNTLIAGIRQLETSLRAVNYDIAKVDPNALQLITDPKYAAAGNRLAAYNKKHCGIITTTTT